MPRVRDYNDIVQRLNVLSQKSWLVHVVGEVWGYPIYSVERHVSSNAPTVFLSGGMHGEEPAGVEGVLTWLESTLWVSWDVNWLILPCINPFGWERNRRSNAQRRDINRHFRQTGICPEADLVKALLENKRFLFSIEFHEDVDAAGYYLYELKRSTPYIGEKIIEEVGGHTQINHHSVIDGNKATGRGLIRRDPNVSGFFSRPRWPMAFHLFKNHTDHLFGSETAVHHPIQQRAQSHITALQTALKYLIR